MISVAQKQEVEAEFGMLYELNGKNNVIFFNEQGFARLYQLVHNPVYIPEENSLYAYEASTGLWKQRDHDCLVHQLSLFLHECALEWNVPGIETKRKPSVLTNIIKFLRAICRREKFFDRSGRFFIHCANGVLELDTAGNWELKPFSEDYHSRNRCQLEYVPGQVCPKFLNELLHPLIEADDHSLLQRYIGQCVVGRNLTQSILLLTGSGGSGKGTLANIVEMIVGEANYTQIRPESITGRFETSFFMNKTLLTGKESKTSFFTANGMSILKSLTGGDAMRVELKSSNRHEMIDGDFNVFIVGNPVPHLKFESEEDQSAWRRRLRWIRCKNHKPSNPIPDFAKKLYAEEGSGILNWALKGARDIILSGRSELPCDESQTARLDYLFASATPLDLFLNLSVEKNRGTNITGDELFTVFVDFCTAMEWPLMNSRDFQRCLPEAMMKRFQAPLRRDVPRRKTDGKFTNRAGYFHVRFKGAE